MDEREFDANADQMMLSLEQAVEAEPGGIDFEVKPGGIIEIECDDGSKVIINKHRAAREIWIAARSGGYHFRYDSGNWVDTRDGESLAERLSQCLSEQAGRRITLA